MIEQQARNITAPTMEIILPQPPSLREKTSAWIKKNPTLAALHVGRIDHCVNYFNAADRSDSPLKIDLPNGLLPSVRELGISHRSNSKIGDALTAAVADSISDYPYSGITIGNNQEMQLRVRSLATFDEKALLLMTAGYAEIVRKIAKTHGNDIYPKMIIDALINTAKLHKRVPALSDFFEYFTWLNKINWHSTPGVQSVNWNHPEEPRIRSVRGLSPTPYSY